MRTEKRRQGPGGRKSLNSGGPLVDKEKQEPPGCQETFCIVSVLEADKER